MPPAPQALPLGISLIKRRNRLWGLREAIFMLGIVEKTVRLSTSILLADKLGTSAFSRRTFSAPGALSFVVVLFKIALACLGNFGWTFSFFFQRNQIGQNLYTFYRNILKHCCRWQEQISAAGSRKTFQKYEWLRFKRVFESLL